MSAVIKTNMSALRTYNLLNSNQSHAQKHMLKVSTGLKLNSAKDDASAYSISERMRVRIRALDQAHQNTQNGSSMIKTAEGAVSNILETLRTLKEKAIDAANDSNTDEDRRIMQKEFNQFVDQIDDDALVQFNGMYLINNSRNNAIASTRAHLLSTNFTANKLTLDNVTSNSFTDLKDLSGNSLGINDDDIISWSFYSNIIGTFHGELKGSNTIRDLSSKLYNLDPKVKWKFYAYDQFRAEGTWRLVGVSDRYGVKTHNYKNGLWIYSVPEESSISFNITVMDKEGNINQKATQLFKFEETLRPESKSGDQALRFQVGTQANQVTKIALTDMRAQALGLKGKSFYAGKYLSISTQKDANLAITAIETAINRVLDEQSNIGSFLSRMEYTASNLTTAYTNDQASESVIRDADMATEMASYLKYNILSQSSQAMLAQANQNPLNVLSLLNGETY